MKNNFYFKNIDILRAFAAISVVIYHCIELLPWQDFVTRGLLLWFRIGWLGVDLFFVISGFVISLSAIKLFRTNRSAFRKIFIRHRFARIMPLYYLTAIVFIIFIEPGIVTLGLFETFRHLLSHIFFIHNWGTVTHGSINGANWSLGAEMQFYLLVLLTVGWLSRVNPWKLLVGMVLTAWVYRGFVFFILGGSGDTFTLFVYSTQVIGMFDEFGFGIFLAKIVLDRDTFILPNISRFIDSALVWLGCAIVSIWGGLYLLWSIPGYWETWWMVTFWRTFAAIGCFFVVGAFMVLKLPVFVSSYITPPLRYLGTISYGIYLWHLLAIKWVQHYNIDDPATNTMYIIALTIALGSISWHFIEKPILKKYR